MKPSYPIQIKPIRDAMNDICLEIENKQKQQQKRIIDITQRLIALQNAYAQRQQSFVKYQFYQQIQKRKQEKIKMQIPKTADGKSSKDTESDDENEYINLVNNTDFESSDSSDAIPF
ncbi:hypothetical protein TVAG_423010 [Trichomonas vaginalis G3]|uniref:Uncharacterized protein n=1 Tax=Trichomonas vaginalis (strain ATCC PRA-98 / G3) TaxID=412133 RepID=A2DTE0_TRIV3|nr:hypothetical protein TVAGG3_0592980 [Trichomonas vaginalis G3]EAY16249.1 hypothetical protein TVAG_423010 [Trichomonas vaginalis G3]KAI5523388.1 hypothetical protein TVAGG3_0592980 [Trichomonas vaginalis G3]|eukprot:XP_001328472.1 hypothetical protein [Trichomonas vaginalis G3]